MSNIVSRLAATRDKPLSIHPRSWPGMHDAESKNTCKPRSIARLQRALAGIERHIENHPRDGAAQQRADNLRRRIG